MSGKNTAVVKGNRKKDFDEKRLTDFCIKFASDEPKYIERVLKTIKAKPEVTGNQITNILIDCANDLIDVDAPQWTFVASRVYLQRLYKQSAINRCYDVEEKYGDFIGLLKHLASESVYSETILKVYTHAELVEAGKLIKPENDLLFDYIGLMKLNKRYLAKDLEDKVFELPQERLLNIALYLMSNEPPNKRMEFVKEAYWVLSNGIYSTVATPILRSSGKANGQMASCFIDTVHDSLDGIYNSNTDTARLSKQGGGIGLYMGKVRAKGSSIRGHKGASTGVIPWCKQLENTAVSVDQLGQRSGAVAVYLDAWHPDIFDFLDLHANNGEERRRAKKLQIGVCIPDLFMEMVEQGRNWCLFDPHEVRQVMGWSLEDCYDEEKGKGTFRERYELCYKNDKLHKTIIPAKKLMNAIMKLQLEDGFPYMFYRDTANRANPNKHKGMVYGSNICTEIIQNMSPTIITKEIRENGKAFIEKELGDYVVCTLASVNLARAYIDGVMPRAIKILVRMLDNVLDLNNNIGVLQAEATNQKYRAIGLGTFGWHQLLALKAIEWESDKAVEFCDKIYEEFAFHTIEASMELSKEKGAYPMFEGSDWENGDYFTQREYKGEDWEKLAEDVKLHGIRNGYLMAVAPNGSTAQIASSTQGIDPVLSQMFIHENKDYKGYVTAPDLNHNTYYYYKPARAIDQAWSVKQNAVRSRHIDQGISFNLYLTNTVKAGVVASLHLQAWRSGVKTTYYTSSEAMEVCESCT